MILVSITPHLYLVTDSKKPIQRPVAVASGKRCDHHRMIHTFLLDSRAKYDDLTFRDRLVLLWSASFCSGSGSVVWRCCCALSKKSWPIQGPCFNEVAANMVGRKLPTNCTVKTFGGLRSKHDYYKWARTLLGAPGIAPRKKLLGAHFFWIPRPTTQKLFSKNPAFRFQRQSCCKKSPWMFFNPSIRRKSYLRQQRVLLLVGAQTTFNIHIYLDKRYWGYCCSFDHAKGSSSLGCE